MTHKKTVLIVEDHLMLRDGLKAILSTRDDLEIIAEAGDGLEALRIINKTPPDLILLDLSLPLMNGTSVLLDVKANHPDIKSLVLTIHESETQVEEAFAAGADGYCSKQGNRMELLLAIDSVLAGKAYVSPSISRMILEGYLATRRHDHPPSAWDHVSQREREILKLLAEGYTNKKIGEMLHISAKTVEKHRSNIMAKLKVHNVASLTTLAIEKGLTEQPERSGRPKEAHPAES
ncbi:MAG: response regulator transcription factor [Desulfosarcinaceae bacterium]|jgi:DNA-binding NarL/FixJ family response regulator